MSKRPLFILGVFGSLSLAPFASLLACTSLTTPPEPEDIQTSTMTTTSASASPAFSGAQLKKPVVDALASAKAAAPEAPLDIKTTAPGSGTGAKAGDTVAVDYIGTLADGGKEFDRSRGKPFTFKLGGGQVIKGWDQGLVGMKPGEKRRLTIPASLAYGPVGHPPQIPGNSTLVFDVTMEKITPGQ
ncbi:MAG: FKBP-type peptidyl-prolyl cis-trans isomerase [Polyangiaceae bacterium]